MIASALVARILRRHRHHVVVRCKMLERFEKSALFAASVLGIYNIYKEGSAELNFLAIIAVIFSFIFSYFTIALFLKFIQKFSLNAFIFYRIVLSLFILALVYL